MSRPRNLGDNPNYYADDDTGFDSEGYILAPGTDGNDTREVRKYGTDGSTTFVGVNHKATWNYDATEVRMGEPVGVAQEGEVLVLVLGDRSYSFGEEIVADDSPGTGLEGVGGVSGDVNTAGDVVGTVNEDKDLSDLAADEAGLVKVNITGRA